MRPFDLYPEEMRSLKQWVLWRIDYVDGTPRKVPYQITGRKAQSNNPVTWSTYEEAWEALKRNSGSFNGLGFVFTKESHIVFVDLDHCIDEDGVLNDIAVEVRSTLSEAFVELSQSKTGLHFFTLGEIPEALKTKQIEMYSSGRFCALTGVIYHRRWTGKLTDETPGLMDLFLKYKKKTSRKQHRPVVRASDLELSDAAILDLAMNNQKFSKLYSGDWSGYGSQSEADLALCVKIAFYTGNCPEKIDMIFRSSGLFRPKWDTRHFKNGMTYGEFTVMKAGDLVEETYSDWIRRVNNDRFQEINESFGNLF